MILVTNYIAVAISLGLLAPWAIVRAYRYRIEHLAITTNRDLESFISAEREEVDAFSEEFGDFFDVDLGL